MLQLVKMQTCIISLNVELINSSRFPNYSTALFWSHLEFGGQTKFLSWLVS